MKIEVKSSGYEEVFLPEGKYPAVVESVEERETKNGARILFEFGVEHEGETYIKSAWANPTNSEMGKLVQFAKAILGEVGESFDTDELVGKPCVVKIEDYTNKEGEEKQTVREVKPPGKGQKAKAPPANAAAQEDEEDFDEIPF